MEAFDRQVLTRLPLAEAMWTLLRYVVTPSFASELFERHRGTGSERLIEFGTLVELVGEALTQHGGSGRQSFEAAKRDGRLAATVRAVYGKLGRIPARLSQAFLREATARLNAVLPEPTAALPASLREFRVVAVDGENIKRVAKRLKVLRGRTSGMLGGKDVVALSLNSHLAIAMEASLNGDAKASRQEVLIQERLDCMVDGHPIVLSSLLMESTQEAAAIWVVVIQVDVECC